MRTTALVLLALLAATALTPGIAAQPPTFTEPFQVRAGLGDIPTTPAVEPAGTWNVEQLLVVQATAGASEAARTFTFRVPAGATVVNATCDCTGTSSVNGNTLSFVLDAATSGGERTIRVLTKQPMNDVVGFLAAPGVPSDGVVVLYVPIGSSASASIPLTEVGQSTSGTSTIHYARFTAGQFPWFAVHPAAAVAGPGSADDSYLSGLAQNWLLIVVGLVAGMVLWAVLVSKGLVQAKSRKQVVQTAAHTEAAANDPPAVLEGKKRALLAALKEVELAKQANEMPLEVYDAVKADLKKQAVTVMRALETTSDSPDSR